MCERAAAACLCCSFLGSSLRSGSDAERFDRLRGLRGAHTLVSLLSCSVLALLTPNALLEPFKIAMVSFVGFSGSNGGFRIRRGPGSRPFRVSCRLPTSKGVYEREYAFVVKLVGRDEM